MWCPLACLQPNAEALLLMTGDLTPPLDPVPRTVRAGLEWKAFKSPALISNAGGSCNVYKATLDGERVAVKVVREVGNADAIRDLQAEAKLLTELGRRPHRHIITLIGEGCKEDGQPFIVLELLATTLAAQLPKPLIRMLGEPNEPDEVGVCEWWSAVRLWPMSRALIVGLHLAQALKHLHEGEPLPGQRVLHRDLKPDNVGFLADGSNTLVLLDFGLATRWSTGIESSGGGEGDEPRKLETNLGDSTSQGDEPRKLTGQTGSTRYMSPEVALSQPYNGKAEVFSFATILWQMASHERPFRGFNVEEFEARVARGGERPSLPQHWPEGLRELLRDCWQAEPHRRPGFGAVVRRLEALLRQEAGELVGRGQQASRAEHVTSGLAGAPVTGVMSDDAREICMDRV